MKARDNNSEVLACAAMHIAGSVEGVFRDWGPGIRLEAAFNAHHTTHLDSLRRRRHARGRYSVPGLSWREDPREPTGGHHALPETQAAATRPERLRDVLMWTDS